MNELPALLGYGLQLESLTLTAQDIGSFESPCVVSVKTCSLIALTKQMTLICRYAHLHVPDSLELACIRVRVIARVNMCLFPNSTEVFLRRKTLLQCTFCTSNLLPPHGDFLQTGA